MTPLERLREAAAVPADDVTVSRADLAELLELLDHREASIRELCVMVTGYDDDR